ncbi:dipeptidase [Parasphingorhabdus halotolerans]|uniref:Peptidase M19 n=1 Tax=Parasphingorhabdus halotolerans TaxID=2725558 RepID=A0A6H2DMU4_9SPHN|nr:dipeptidase [Parasphingorhabdus halotolerans]QJB69992.1 peptidase M19 [Parasphingorhabdus halotolerans]
MKKFLLSFFGLFAIATAAFFIFAPSVFEKQTNMVDGKSLPPITPEAQELHDSLMIVDLHGDTLLWKRKITDSVDRGHIDLQRLQQGNVGLQIFSSVTKTPRGQNYDSNSADTDQITLLAIAQLQPYRTWFSILERQLWHATKLGRAVADSDGAITLISKPADIDGLSGNDRPIGVLFSAEGLQSLEGKRANLQKLYDAGMRMAGLVHFFDNELAGSMHGEKKGGLTDFGRQIVTDMEDMGMIVDIAHSSHATVAEVLKIARRPVVSSHGGLQAVCGVNRNLTDEEIKGVAATGGVIGLGYWDGAMCDTDPKSVAKAVKHVRDLVGIEFVALGSDFDGAVTTRFDTSGIVHITQAFMDAGFNEDEIRAVMGLNALRVLRQGMSPLKDLPKQAVEPTQESSQ